MNELIFKLIELAVVVIVIIVTRYLIPWLQSQMSAEQLRVARSIAEVAVLATQQVYGELSGEERKTIAVHHVHTLCEIQGIKLTELQIDALIEAAVKAKNMAEGK